MQGEDINSVPDFNIEIIHDSIVAFCVFFLKMLPLNFSILLIH